MYASLMISLIIVFHPCLLKGLQGTSSVAMDYAKYSYSSACFLQCLGYFGHIKMFREAFSLRTRRKCSLIVPKVAEEPQQRFSSCLCGINSRPCRYSSYVAVDSMSLSTWWRIDWQCGCYVVATCACLHQ